MQDALAREHVSTKAHWHVSTQGTLAREHVNTQGTLAHENVSMLAREYIFSTQGTQFSRLMITGLYHQKSSENYIFSDGLR